MLGLLEEILPVLGLRIRALALVIGGFPASTEREGIARTGTFTLRTSNEPFAASSAIRTTDTSSRRLRPPWVVVHDRADVVLRRG
jgi:hypothetical protein